MKTIKNILRKINDSVLHILMIYGPIQILIYIWNTTKIFNYLQQLVHTKINDNGNIYIYCHIRVIISFLLQLPF